MDGVTTVATSDNRSREWLWLAAALLVALSVQLPALQLGFVGDDYEWWLETRYRMVDYGRALEPFGGLRLTNPLMLVPDQLVWGNWTPGWHLTSIAIHGIVVGLLFFVARRVGFGPPGAGVIAALWGASPFTVFMAREVHVRHDPLLLACWLGLALLWPGPDDRWTWRRIAGGVALAATSALTKESWVVLPGFAAAYDLAFRRSTLTSALRTAAIWSIGPVLFVAAYLLRPAVETSYAAGYYSGGLRTAVKIPSTLAAFTGLVDFDTSSRRFGPADGLALIALAGTAVLAFRSRTPALLVGGALFLLPLIPLVPVPVMGVHYGYASFAGFLLMAGGLAMIVFERTEHRRTRLVVAAVAYGLAAALMSCGLSVMVGETADAIRRAEANQRLVAEAEAFVPRLPRDRAVVCVRLEGLVVSAELIELVEGLPKTYFNRGSAPYGLVGWAELFSWVGEPHEGPLWHEVAPEDLGSTPFAVIGHAQGRFVELPVEDGTAAEAAARWSAKGFPVRVIRPWP